MYNNPEDPTSEYENTLNKLSDQITELFSKIHFYQALVAEKEHQIAELAKENQRLLVKIQDLMFDQLQLIPQVNNLILHLHLVHNLIHHHQPLQSHQIRK